MSGPRCPAPELELELELAPGACDPSRFPPPAPVSCSGDLPRRRRSPAVAPSELPGPRALLPISGASLLRQCAEDHVPGGPQWDLQRQGAWPHEGGLPTYASHDVAAPLPTDTPQQHLCVGGVREACYRYSPDTTIPALARRRGICTLRALGCARDECVPDVCGNQGIASTLVGLHPQRGRPWNPWLHGRPGL